MKDAKPTLTPFVSVSRGGNPVEVATLTRRNDVVLIEITTIAWKEATNSMSTRAHWRVIHMTNHQGDVFHPDKPENTPVLARMGITEPVYSTTIPKFTYQMRARREAVEAAQEFLRIKTKLVIVGNVEEDAA